MPYGEFLRLCRGGYGYYHWAFYPGVSLRSTPGYIRPPLRGETNRDTLPACTTLAGYDVGKGQASSLRLLQSEPVNLREKEIS
jgi:hypothetical protein